MIKIFPPQGSHRSARGELRSFRRAGIPLLLQRSKKEYCGLICPYSLKEKLQRTLSRLPPRAFLLL